MNQARIISSAIMSILMVAVLAACSSDGSDGTLPARIPQTVSGQVVFTDKLAGADITVYDAAGKEVYKAARATGSEGIYTIPKSGLPNIFTIVATGGYTPDGKPFTGYLKRTVKPYDPDDDYDINGLSTLVAVYMERNPSVSYPEAIAAVGKYLSIPDPSNFKDVSASILEADAWFSDTAFWKKAVGDDYNDFVISVVQDIEAGKVVDFGNKSLTADLPPLFDKKLADAKKSVTPISLLFGKTLANSKKAITPTAVLDVVEGIFDGVFEVMDMESDEANTETLERIDGNVSQIMAKLTTIKSQLDSIQGELREAKWDAVDDDLNKLELNCISPARKSFDTLVKFKKQLAAMKPEERKARNDELKSLISDFSARMTKKSCGGLAIDSFEDVLDMYADKATRLDTNKKNAAIQLFADVLNTKADAGGEFSYKSLENQFLRFVYYQAVALQLHLHYELNKPENKGKIDTQKKKIIKRFLTGPDEYDGERMLKQIRRFVPAVESFVANHSNEQYYRRWLYCDRMNSQLGSDCAEYESPLLRSQVISDQLLGHIKDNDGAIAGGKYGLFVKEFRMKVDGVPYPADKPLAFRTADNTKVVLRPISVRGLAAGEIKGKNPYVSYHEKEPAEVEWVVATYWADLSGSGNVTFDLAYEENDSATPIAFRQNIDLRAVTKNGKPYNAFTVWTVPVRDLSSLGAVVSAGWSTQTSYPFLAQGCDNEKCSIYTYGNGGGAGKSRYRLYKVGVTNDVSNVVIAHRANGKRYVLLPADDWQWVGWCGNQQTVYGYADREILLNNFNRIYWNMEQTETNKVWTIGRTNEKGEFKVMCFGNGVSQGTGGSNLYYGWTNCLHSAYSIEPEFDGAWK